MPLPPDDIRAKLAQLRNEFAMRAALQSEYDKEMSGKYIHEMIPFEDWLAQRNAPTGKAKGGLVWNSPDWKPHPENDLLQPIGASRMIGDERLLSQDDTFSHGLSEFPSSKKSYRYLYHGEDNKPIGAMQIQTAGPRSKKAVIQNLYVAEANRRQGIASKLLDRAREDFDVKHSTDLTTAGRAFARAKKASGGSVPSLDVMRLAIGGQGPRNWLKGSVEKVIEPLKQPEIYDPGLQYELHKNAINKWIEGNLGNYIRKQLGHPNDPIRKLAEEGVLHTDPTRVEIIGGDNDMGTHANRRREMFGGQKMAKGPLAQAWEDAVDTRFEGYKIKDLQGMPEMHEGQYEPWMDKADPNTLIFEPYAFDELGFDHIVDVLKEDLAQGRIRPEQLSKVSIEQAVRRTHEVDQANKKAMTEASLKTTEGMPVHKDYGDGFKWIELAMPEMPKELPEGWTMKVPKAGLMRASKPDPVDPRNDITRLGQDLPELIKNIYYRRPETPGNPFQKLKDALAYESDVMGHCVGGERLPDGTRTGGYANDVKAGNTRIFSLRDAKNEPHVTVEVRPEKNPYLGYSGNITDAGVQKIRRMFPDSDFDLEYGEWFKNHGGHSMHFAKEYAPWIKRNHPEIYEATIGAPMGHAIKQIKGKGNAKPKKDYIPYVQDFVKSGNWSDVGDINNAEMRDIHPESDLAKAMQQKGLQAPKYVTEQEMSGLLKEHNQGLYSWEKAEGGEVDAEAVFMGKGGKVKELEQYLRQREGEYGVKRLQRAADEIPGLENMYTLQALKEAFGGDNAKALMTMNPADFEKFAVRLFSDPDTREEEMEERIERGQGLPPMSHHEYIKHLAKIKGGFADVPFLEVNKRPEYLPNISGHEGRHRSRAMVTKGAQKSLVRLLPSPSMREPMPRRYREDFIEAMKKELGEKRLVTGEGRSLLPADLEAPEHKNIERRNMLGGRPQLPEIYKDGGDVDAESVFFPKSKE